MSVTIRTVIVDDEAPYRNALQKTLSLMPECDIVAVCVDGQEALEVCLKNPPDVLLTDINMPRMSGIELIKKLKQQEKSVNVVVLTVNEDDDTIFDAISAGALGYLLKTSTPQEVVDAIRVAETGGAKISPKIAARIIGAFPPRDARPKAVEADFYVLSPREEEILDLMAKGMRNKEIADKLFIAEKTVKNHVSSILEKLQVNSRTEAVIMQLERKAGGS
ncbi:MAG TPA: response regulator transcription factor [Fimbriimonadaceae bacterium]|nr:response regulator transcription factor [Fimbriimonadaceae bacterium]